MEMIEELPSKKDYRGWAERWGLFLCSYCLQKVERRLQCGLRDKSCGCVRYKLSAGSMTKHGDGKKRTKLYYIWNNIKQRCLNPNNKRYKDYGGRGIIVCPEWTNNYIVFRLWSLTNGYQEGLEIDRIDNNGNYEPSNCRWTTRTENMRNTRRIKLSLKIAIKIRELYKTGKYKQINLARLFNFRPDTISDIINNKLWVE